MSTWFLNIYIEQKWHIFPAIGSDYFVCPGVRVSTTEQGSECSQQQPVVYCWRCRPSGIPVSFWRRGLRGCRWSCWRWSVWSVRVAARQQPRIRAPAALRSPRQLPQLSAVQRRVQGQGQVHQLKGWSVDGLWTLYHLIEMEGGWFFIFRLYKFV